MNLPPSDPILETDLRTQVEPIHAKFLDRFEGYLSEEAKARMKTTQDRLFILPQEDISTFLQAWTGVSKSYRGLHINYGDLIVVADRKYIDYDLLTEEQKDEYIDEFGNERAAKKHVRQVRSRMTLVHELTHDLQANATPDWFKECAASFFTERICRDIDQEVIPVNHTQQRSDIFWHLHEQFGDDVYRLFFGTLEDGQLRDQILRGVAHSDLVEVGLLK